MCIPHLTGVCGLAAAAGALWYMCAAVQARYMERDAAELGAAGAGSMQGGDAMQAMFVQVSIPAPTRIHAQDCCFRST